MTNILPKQNTPCCGYEIEAASPVAGAKDAPKPGDFTICIKCGAWLVLDDNMAVRTLNADDILAITDEQRDLMRRATALIRDPK